MDLVGLSIVFAACGYGFGVLVGLQLGPSQPEKQNKWCFVHELYIYIYIFCFFHFAVVGGVGPGSNQQKTILVLRYVSY